MTSTNPPTRKTPTSPALRVWLEEPALRIRCRFEDWVDVTARWEDPRAALLKGKIRPNWQADRPVADAEGLPELAGIRAASQLLGPPERREPTEVVRHLLAVQAQDFA